MSTATHDWYTVVSFGGAYHNHMPPTGPWRGLDAAQAAMDRWADGNPDAGSLRAATNASIVGPFCTRARAAEADISDWPSHTCRHHPLDEPERHTTRIKVIGDADDPTAHLVEKVLARCREAGMRAVQAEDLGTPTTWGRDRILWVEVSSETEADYDARSDTLAVY